MDDLDYREVSQPERLKAHTLEPTDLVWLGRNAGAVIGTGLDSHAWPTQLDVYHDVDADKTIVRPTGQHNSVIPYKLNGIIDARDVKKHFIATIVEPAVEAAQPTPEADAPMASDLSEVSGNGGTVDSVSEAIDADDPPTDEEFWDETAEKEEDEE